MIRVAIIDHETHNLYIEDLDEEVLEKEYEGSEEAYIEDTHELGKHWTWDYIVRTEYYPNMDSADGIEVEFSDLTD